MFCNMCMDLRYHITKDYNFDLAEAGIEPGAARWKSCAELSWDRESGNTLTTNFGEYLDYAVLFKNNSEFGN